MAKLIITRPGNHRFWHASLIRRWFRYGILVDGRRMATIARGNTIGLSLSQGSHQVRAKFGIFGSQPIHIDATPEKRVQLVAGPGVQWQNLILLASFVVLMSTLPLFWSIAWVAYHGLDGILAGDVDWLGVFLLSNVSVLILASLFQLIVPVVLRNRAIELIELPRLHLTELALSDIVRPQPFYSRFTTGHLMIVVAILAVVISTAATFSRNERSNYFRKKADTHASAEAATREVERILVDAEATTREVERILVDPEATTREVERIMVDAGATTREVERILVDPEAIREVERILLDLAVDLGKAGLKYGQLHEMVAKTRAQADYHAALRHKYEHAASQGRFYVEADPPEPVWP